MRKRVADYIADFLVEKGIDHVFTVTGGGAMHLNDGLGHKAGLRCIYNHHEQACAMAAESYARINRRMAAVCVTTGPGGTNAITGVLGAWLDSIPMLVLSGQVRYDTTVRSTGLKLRGYGDQEFDITRAVGCMTKYAEMVIRPEDIRKCLEKAVYLAQTGRPGPCWLDIPVNVQGAYVETETLAGYEPEGEGESCPGKDCLGEGTPAGEGQAESSRGESCQGESAREIPPWVSDGQVQEILERIRRAERPVLNAGNGIRIAGGAEVFRKVVEKLNIPVVTGWNSIDLMENENELYVGRAGIMGDRAGNWAVQNSDLLLSVGSRLSIRQVGYQYQSWAREAFTIVEDIDREELKKPDLHIDMPLWADAADLLEALDRNLPEGKLWNGEKWLSVCKGWKRDFPVVQEKHRAQQGRTNVYAFVEALSSRLPEGQITVVGNGSACVVGSQAYVIKPGQRFIVNSAVASMGYDLPAAIGACFGSRKQEIICVTGDGSIQMNLQELQTIIHHRLPIKIFVINNEGYHSIRQTQSNFFGGPLVGIGADSGDLSFPRMEALAAAYGYPYYSIEKNAQLERITEVLAAAGPCICEVFVDREQRFEPKAASKRLEDGSMVSAPLEDLAPFLPREELEKQMYIAMWGE